MEDTFKKRPPSRTGSVSGTAAEASVSGVISTAEVVTGAVSRTGACAPEQADRFISIRKGNKKARTGFITCKPLIFVQWARNVCSIPHRRELFHIIPHYVAQVKHFKGRISIKAGFIRKARRAPAQA